MLLLEHQLELAESDRIKLHKETVGMREQLSKLELSRKELADEYVQLKTSYMSLADERDAEVSLTV